MTEHRVGTSPRHTTARVVTDRTENVAAANEQRDADELIAKLTRVDAHLQAALSELSTVSALTDRQRAHLPRARAHADRYLQLLAELASTKSVLAPVSQLAPGIVADVRIGAAADRVLDRLHRVQRPLADLALEHHSHAFTAGLDIYATATSLARVHHELEADLAPVTDYLARNPDSTPAEPPVADPTKSA